MANRGLQGPGDQRGRCGGLNGEPPGVWGRSSSDKATPPPCQGEGRFRGITMRSALVFASLFLASWLALPLACADMPVRVTVDARAGLHPISPYLYGRNGALQPDGDDLLRASGLRITRETGGNNCTKYNWRLDLSSHPDWYNNVYKQNWPERAQRLQRDFTDLQGLFGFQVLGWVAKTDAVNFHEQEVNPRPESHLNLCGGGTPTLYLQPWTAKDTVDILDYWFGPNGLKLDPARFHYWHLDNEPECWMSTHDDICPKDFSPEECVRRYAAVAREVKTRYPQFRLLAPGFTSEWMWWNWNNNFVQGMPWVEFFIKRMAEESKAAGVRLIDVLDFHTYASPANGTDEDLLQEYRIFYDPDYKFPGANGCKKYPDGGWHEDQKVEMIFGRAEQWLEKYFGPGHGITLGVTEAAPAQKREMVTALWYASMLGTFADHGVEVFTPWDWRESWWEVVHLFSHYAGTRRVESRCDAEPTVSAYSSLAASGKSLTVLLLNRSASETASVQIALAGFKPLQGPATTLQLANLPEDQRTFKSDTDNALRRGTVPVGKSGVTISLPPYSITAVVLEGAVAAP